MSSAGQHGSAHGGHGTETAPYERVFRGEQEERAPEQSIRARREDGDPLVSRHAENIAQQSIRIVFCIESPPL